MKTFRYLSTAIAATFFATATPNFAASKTTSQQPAAPAPETLTLGTPRYLINAFFTGQALQPFVNNSDYGVHALPFNYGDSLPAVSPSWTIPVVPAEFHFGFDLGVVGSFKDAKSALAINWQWCHTSDDSASFTVPSAQDMIGPFFEIGPDGSDFKTAKGTMSYHFDQVNIDYGTFVNFAHRMESFWYAGVGFARIVEHRFSRFSDLANTIIRTIDSPAKFIGAGPQVGLDFHYKIVKALCFDVKTRASLFVGTFTNDTDYSTTSAALVSLNQLNPNLQSTSVNNISGIVPGLETKLGFSYDWGFRNYYTFKLEAGYQAQLYVNAIRSVDMGSEVTLNAADTAGSSTTGVYGRTFERVVSDFALAGPYVSMDLAY